MKETWIKRLYVAGLALFGLGLILTVVSWLRLCSDACEEVHFYRFYGMLFEPLGMVFFLVGGFFHWMSQKSKWYGYAASLMVAGAIGAELNLIRVQKFVIGHWCPVCLSIATVIFLIGAVYVALFILTKGFNMKKGITTCLFLLMGFAVAYVGVFKPEQSFADGIEGGAEDPAFGNKKSSIEVYVVTDWFCPACNRLEPTLERILPSVMKKARVYFVDYAIHPETMNYVPYNLSFMLKNKKEYFRIRQVLHELAEKTKAPTEEQVEQAVAPLHVKYEQLNYADVESGIRFAQGIVKTFNVDQTPTLVIANRETLDGKKLVGSEITQENVNKAILSLEK